MLATVRAFMKQAIRRYNRVGVDKVLMWQRRGRCWWKGGIRYPSDSVTASCEDTMNI